MPKIKKITFTDEMEKDFELVRNMFSSRFNIEPSNSDITKFMLGIVKRQNFDAQRKPRSKEFVFKW